ncbi:GNAT family N-acetyltransferase [Streptomyces aidingensis]|uniref:Protein N-acetyltransferase, RimJ/RimL family n=1 Tax=Streptomyces aidingensis TaxID=910347 RepID=A0A1I1DWD0_9ACTN|nr:GNAT family N-acetyltransferase [Streptomyces aidingensis]SFB79104.1 Protein N-acetyltransferase, RimJ/RimL family [Streptomyces aidingensis]
MSSPSQPDVLWSPDFRLVGYGIHLRQWADEDLAGMVELFDDPDVARWTPLASPFDLEAARAYVVKARALRAGGQGVNLAVTLDGGEALGGAVMFRNAEEEREIELGYVIGPRHRGRGLARRALRLLAEHARAADFGRIVLRIEPGNLASTAVARAAGFRLTEERADRELKGETTVLETWVLP